jgi:hypothetical protein
LIKRRKLSIGDIFGDVCGEICFDGAFSQFVIRKALAEIKVRFEFTKAVKSSTTALVFLLASDFLPVYIRLQRYHEEKKQKHGLALSFRT